MRIKRLVLGLGVLGSLTAVSYGVGRAVERAEQISFEEQYPSQDEIQALHSEVLYSSSMTEMLYPQVFDGGMQPAGSPTTYANSAVIQWLLEEDNVPQYDSNDMDKSEETLYKVTGDVTITDADEEDGLFVHTVKTGDEEFEAYGSVENYSSQVQSVVNQHGFHTVEDVTGIFTVVNDEGHVHFMCLVSESSSQ